MIGLLLGIGYDTNNPSIWCFPFWTIAISTSVHNNLSSHLTSMNCNKFEDDLLLVPYYNTNVISIVPFEPHRSAMLNVSDAATHSARTRQKERRRTLKHTQTSSLVRCTISNVLCIPLYLPLDLSLVAANHTPGRPSLLHVAPNFTPDWFQTGRR